MKFPSSPCLPVDDNKCSMVRKTLVLLAIGTASLFGQPPTPDALFQTAVNQLASKQFVEAKESFRLLREREPASVRGAVGVAQTLLAQGLRTDAVTYMTGEVAKDSANPKLNVVLGDIALQAGQINIAVTRYVRTLELLSKDPNAGGFYVRRSTRRGTEIVSDPLGTALDNFVGNDPTPPGPGGVYLRLAEALLRGGDAARGIEALEAARRLLPSDVGLLLDLALLYDNAKNQPRAIAAYRDFLKLAPDHVTGLNNLAFLLADTGGDLDEALRDALRARELQPQADEVADTLGWVYFKRKAYPEALGIFAKLVQKSPENMIHRDRLRQVLDQTGGTSTAVTELKTALAEPSAEAANLSLSAMIARMYPPQ